ncbi:dTDP-4-dehydrorhamnose 3 5-epimerase [Paramagnetospirillum magnetotacticum MS-1]|uniref:dTDP-4-dehydrorhamnose 3,5-epimerase n=1 Tax=Paramagnetospirillum magnetotacticum MS-1 TaxID=272627 RepID=A0A0C2V6S3_PARME|nr:dTDP-4-dehydrorhamnose 3,5-epimerase [Paramagnetospirillum magnetotacticum]KIM00752.1 dTDP-4-dehydrorhamnose 3 5-epimerase [Paramagnetospirillum magnetotacticum MS-1]
MNVISLAIPEVKVLTPKRFGDDRGFFAETYNAHILAEHGITAVFVQDNQSFSRPAGVVRGLHFQREPYAQDKLLRVVRGAILDAVVDIRPGSPSFGQAVTVELSSEDSASIFVPKGFAHGFMTLEPDTEVFYKVSYRYTPEAEGGIHWRDPDLAISWPLDRIGGEGAVTIAARDQSFGLLRDLALL